MKRLNQSGLKFRKFLFTLNNYTSEEETQIKSWDVKYLVFGHEVCPTTQTPHLQGYCILGKQLTQNQVKKLPGFSRAHFEAPRGSDKANYEYCSKDATEIFEKGTLPKQGSRSDLVSTVEALRKGSTLEEVANTTEGCINIVKYPRGLTLLKSISTPKRSIPPLVVWLFGTTGTGKTRAAIAAAERLFPNDEAWISGKNLEWFDGYENNPTSIIDDYRPSFTTFAFLLRLLDRYPLRVPIKGGFTQWNPALIIITTNKSARDIWSYRTEEDLDQLSRRIHTIREQPYDLSDLQITEPRRVEMSVQHGTDNDQSTVEFIDSGSGEDGIFHV